MHVHSSSTNGNRVYDEENATGIKRLCQRTLTKSLLNLKVLWAETFGKADRTIYAAVSVSGDSGGLELYIYIYIYL